MTRGELCIFLEKRAKKYRKLANHSIKRNTHMHDCRQRYISQKIIDALLVDFINYIGTDQCIDYGLYTKDIKYD